MDQAYIKLYNNNKVLDNELTISNKKLLFKTKKML